MTLSEVADQCMELHALGHAANVNLEDHVEEYAASWGYTLEEVEAEWFNNE